MKILSLLIILVLGLIMVGSHTIKETFSPKYDQNFEFSELKNIVQVKRDAYGVPHIKAENSEDAYFVLGFLMAQDRLFQMDLYRRAAAGRLSEVLGAETLEMDKVARSLNLVNSMEKIFKKYKNQLDLKMLASLHKFLKGVNQFIETEPTPIEFRLLGYQPEPFNLRDILGMAGQLALGFAHALKADLLHPELMKILPLKEMPIFFPSGIDFKNFKPNQVSFIQAKMKASSRLGLEEYLFNYAGFVGSNAALISKDKMEKGGPVLLNDPHLRYTVPNLWYEAHLITPERNLYGHFLPNVPFPILGQTDNFAWGLTVSFVDDMDMILLKKVRNEGKVNYQHNSKILAHEIVKEVIKVKGEKDIIFHLPITEFGPILDPLFPSDSKHSYLLHWSYYHPENRVFQAFYEMVTARSQEEFFSGVKKIAAPGVNVLYAHKNGSFEWKVAGKIPKRRFKEEGFAPRRGLDLNKLWGEYLPFDQNPGAKNSTVGFIGSANFLPEEYNLAGYYHTPHRYYRLEERLSKESKFSFEEVKQIPNDNFSSLASSVLHRMLLDLDKNSLKSKKEKKVFEVLSDWDYMTDADSSAALIFYSWMESLLAHTLKIKVTHSQYKQICDLPHSTYFIKNLLTGDHPFWWDNPQTSKFETRRDILTKTFKKTLRNLTNSFGSRLDTWKYGSLHLKGYDHPLGRYWPISLLFNKKPIPLSGGPGILNNQKFSLCDGPTLPFSGPSTRRAVDLSQHYPARGILPHGNSGNPFSPFYGDQRYQFVDSQDRQQISTWGSFKALHQQSFLPLGAAGKSDSHLQSGSEL